MLSILSALGTARSVLTSTVGRYALVGLVGLGVGWHYRGRLDHSEELRAQLVATEKNLAAQKVIAQVADQRQRAADAEAAALQKKVNAYAAELKKRPVSSVCRATRDDVGRLSGIR